jgi:diketogulonate reductase-like aldo/keto reductase
VSSPSIVYGTAWKEEATEALVYGALRAGFRAIDTANQRKHYFEEAVGAGIARAGIPRDELWLQSKFTHRAGQDARLPYDEHAPMGEQVRQSFASTLSHLGTDRMDAMLLHGPSLREGLADEDIEVWRALEGLVDGGRVGAIGVSNVSAAQLEKVIAIARVAPAYVQNRCYASRGWDREVRAVCTRGGIRYQGFSLLTANRDVHHHASVRAAARRIGATPAQVIFRFAKQRGMLPLTGTSSAAHMAEDLAAIGDDARFALTDAELDAIDHAGDPA